MRVCRNKRDQEAVLSDSDAPPEKLTLPESLVLEKRTESESTTSSVSMAHLTLWGAGALAMGIGGYFGLQVRTALRLAAMAR